MQIFIVPMCNNDCLLFISKFQCGKSNHLTQNVIKNTFSLLFLKIWRYLNYENLWQILWKKMMACKHVFCFYLILNIYVQYWNIIVDLFFTDDKLYCQVCLFISKTTHIISNFVYNCTSICIFLRLFFYIHLYHCILKKWISIYLLHYVTVINVCI